MSIPSSAAKPGRRPDRALSIPLPACRNGDSACCSCCIFISAIRDERHRATPGIRTRARPLPRPWRHSFSKRGPLTGINHVESCTYRTEAQHAVRSYAAFARMRHSSAELSPTAPISLLDTGKYENLASPGSRTMPPLCGIVLGGGGPIFLAISCKQSTYSGRRQSDRQSYAAGMRHSSGSRL